MLVQMRAVEIAQAMLVGGEVRRHPVEDHADAVLVQLVDEVHEVLRRAVAAGRGEISGRLIAPRAVERMLHHRHEFDVREAHLLHIGAKPCGQSRGRSASGCSLPERAATTRGALRRWISAHSGYWQFCGSPSIPGRPTRNPGSIGPKPFPVISGIERPPGHPSPPCNRSTPTRCNTCTGRPPATPQGSPAKPPKRQTGRAARHAGSIH